MDGFLNKDGKIIITNLIKAIQEKKGYLSELDGQTGDGDHGVNMAKGFSMCGEQIDGSLGFGEALRILGRVLLMETGGSAGPLYGTFFKEMAKACKNEESIDKELFGKMLGDAVSAVALLGGARAGDKTLMDVLFPASEAYGAALSSGMGFSGALSHMKEAAKTGWLSTKGLAAKTGRASRLGERSRGVLDPGATSCYYILDSMADSIESLLG